MYSGNIMVNRGFIGVMVLTALVVAASCCFSQADQRAMARPSVGNPVDIVLSATYDCRFRSAIALADSMIGRDFASSGWKFIRGMITWREIFLGGRNQALESEFQRRMDKVLELGRRDLDRDPNDSSALFVTGGALGYLGLYHWSTGEIMKAASEGKEGLSYHERLLALHPHCYDAYLSLGLFNSYASSVPWYVKPLMWILGRTGSEERGFEYLTLAATKGSLSRIEAEEALAELHVRRHEYDSAFAIYRSLMRAYPHSTYYSLNAVRALFEHKDFSGAAALGNEVISSIDTSEETDKDIERLGLLMVFVSQSYERLGRVDRAIEAIEVLHQIRYARKFDSFRLLSLGRLYWKIGDAEKSKECYEEVIAMNREPNHVQEARQQLGLHSENK
jgi:tetratricopeptide (TPR) repeat protein